MEQSEVFKGVQTKISAIVHQLVLCNKAMEDYEESGNEAEKEIE